MGIQKPSRARPDAYPKRLWAPKRLKIDFSSILGRSGVDFRRFSLEPRATKAQKQNLKKESRDPQRTSWLLRCAVASYCLHDFRNDFQTLHVRLQCCGRRWFAFGISKKCRAIQPSILARALYGLLVLRALLSQTPCSIFFRCEHTSAPSLIIKVYTQLFRFPALPGRDFASSSLSERSQSAFRTLSERFRFPCLLYTSPSPRDVEESRMPASG